MVHFCGLEEGSFEYRSKILNIYLAIGIDVMF